MGSLVCAQSLPCPHWLPQCPPPVPYVTSSRAGREAPGTGLRRRQEVVCSPCRPGPEGEVEAGREAGTHRSVRRGLDSSSRLWASPAVQTLVLPGPPGPLSGPGQVCRIPGVLLQVGLWETQVMTWPDSEPAYLCDLGHRVLTCCADGSRPPSEAVTLSPRLPPRWADGSNLTVAPSLSPLS